MQVRNGGDYLGLDESTCANLDMFPVRGRPKEATLQGVLDATLTPMGARMLHSWLLRPLRDFRDHKRHNAVFRTVDADKRKGDRLPPGFLCFCRGDQPGMFAAGG